MTKQEFIKDLTEKLKSDYDEQALVLTKMLKAIRISRYDRYEHIAHASFQELLKICTDVNKKPLLHEAIVWFRPEIVRMLIDAGADVNLKNEEGNMPLALLDSMLYEQANDEDYTIDEDVAKKMINLLLDAGAEISEEMDFIKGILKEMYSDEIKKELESKANPEVIKKLEEIGRKLSEIDIMIKKGSLRMIEE